MTASEQKEISENSSETKKEEKKIDYLKEEKKIDYLKEDPELYGQKWVCLSFLTPETIKMKSDVRSVKVRGIYGSEEEARNRCEQIRDFDDDFNVYVAPVGHWLPWCDDPEKANDFNYANDKLNDMMKQYYESQEKDKSEFEKRKSDLVKKSLDENKQTRKENKKKEKKKNRKKKKNKITDEIIQEVEKDYEKEIKKQDLEKTKTEEQLKKITEEDNKRKETVSKIDDELKRAEELYEKMLAEEGK